MNVAWKFKSCFTWDLLQRWAPGQNFNCVGHSLNTQQAFLLVNLEIHRSSGINKYLLIVISPQYPPPETQAAKPQKHWLKFTVCVCDAAFKVSLKVRLRSSWCLISSNLNSLNLPNNFKSRVKIQPFTTLCLITKIFIKHHKTCNLFTMHRRDTRFQPFSQSCHP